MNQQKARRQHPAIRPRRLAVSGGSRLTSHAVRFWESLGRAFAHEEGLQVVTGGLKNRSDAAGLIAADWAFVQGLKAELLDDDRALHERVETLVPSSDRDLPTKLTRFREGTVVELRNRNLQSRRFCMVNSADVIISIEGEAGTRTVLDLALAIEKPVLPMPFGEGASPRVWRENLDDIKRWFDISDDEAEQLAQHILADVSDDQMKELAARVKGYILRGFMYKCLVIMPFSEENDPVFDAVIRPILESMRIIPIRVDRLGLTGNAMDVFRQALRSCQGVIADISSNNPNVMYELGMAHAERKPTIILCDGNLTNVPFDLRNHYIIDCSAEPDKLATYLVESLKQVFP